MPYIVAYKIPYLLQKNTPDFQLQLQFQFLGLIYQITIGNVLKLKFIQIQNTIYAITAQSGIYLNCHWALVLKLHQLLYMVGDVTLIWTDFQLW